MAGEGFFVEWQLWQQMTSVLFLLIILTMCAGFVRLQYINRSMRKQELLDVEKKTRLLDMRKTGIPAKRGNDIPFGVRAIQSGIQVDGIWISRPGTPTSITSSDPFDMAKLASSTTLVGPESDSQKKGKQSGEIRPASASTMNHADKAASIRPGNYQKANAMEYKESPSSLAPPKPNSSSSRKTASASQLNVDEDRMKTARNTIASRRTSDADSELSYNFHSNPRMSTNPKEAQPLYGHISQPYPHKEVNDPFATPAPSLYGYSAYDPQVSLLNNQEPSVPSPTFGPSEPVTRYFRRVQNGFEVIEVRPLMTNQRSQAENQKQPSQPLPAATSAIGRQNCGTPSLGQAY